MSEIQKEYVVCIPQKADHHKDSVLRRCNKCFDSVWCMPHNLIRIPLCWECAIKEEDPQFILRKIDVDAAIEHLKEKGGLCGS